MKSRIAAVHHRIIIYLGPPPPPPRTPRVLGGRGSGGGGGWGGIWGCWGTTTPGTLSRVGGWGPRAVAPPPLRLLNGVSTTTPFDAPIPIETHGKPMENQWKTYGKSIENHSKTDDNV